MSNQTKAREKEPNMLIIGCDYHPSMQQIAYVDTETGESGEQRLMHRDGEAERFYRELKPQWSPQNRPTVVRAKPANERGRGLGCSTLQPPVEASLFLCANFGDRI